MHRHDRAGRRRWLLGTAGVWQAPNPVGRGLEKARGKQDAIWLLSRFLPGMCLFKTSRPASCWAVIPKCPQAVLLQLKQVRGLLFVYVCLYGGWFLESTTVTWGGLWSSSNLWDSPNGAPSSSITSSFLPPSNLSDEPLGGSSKNLAFPREFIWNCQTNSDVSGRSPAQLQHLGRRWLKA